MEFRVSSNGAVVDRLISWPVGQRGNRVTVQKCKSSCGLCKGESWDCASGGRWRPQVAGGGAADERPGGGGIRTREALQELTHIAHGRTRPLCDLSIKIKKG